jgi:energy-coupling factor transporter ATP-binding protein EcfA2
MLGEPINDLSEFLREGALSAVNDRYLIYGPPGTGKSLLLAALAAVGTSDEQRVTLIDATEARGDIDEPSFGTEQWFANKALAKGQSTTEKKFYLFDALDELFVAIPRRRVADLLGRSGFSEVCIVTCRSSFYERFLRDGEFARQRTVIEMIEWRDSDSLAEGLAYIDALNGNEEDRGHFAHVHARSAAFRRLCSNPLHLCMIAATLVNTGELHGADVGEEGLLTVYEQWVRSVLSIEAAKHESALSAPDKSYLLEALAWQNHDYSEQDVATAYSVDEVYDWFRRSFSSWCEDREVSPSAAVADLLQHTVLVTRDSSEAVITPQFAFRHRTIEHLFTAAYCCHALSGASNASVREVFQTYLGPDVWRFLQLMLLRASRSDGRAARRMALRGMTALQEAIEEDMQSARSPENRVLREQLGHYLGHLAVPELQVFLRERVREEEDSWVRRGTVIGMSFGGNITICEEYVDLLGAERSAGLSMADNDVNRGTQLSFYGDQLIRDNSSQGIDAHLPQCRRMVDNMISQLLEPERRCTWKLDLYSLIDVVYYREDSGPEGLDVMKKRLRDLEQIYDHLSQDPVAATWDEHQELGEIITDLRRSTS